VTTPGADLAWRSRRRAVRIDRDVDGLLAGRSASQVTAQAAQRHLEIILPP
jgi:hypothetical protein